MSCTTAPGFVLVLIPACGQGRCKRLLPSSKQCNAGNGLLCLANRPEPAMTAGSMCCKNQRREETLQIARLQQSTSGPVERAKPRCSVRTWSPDSKRDRRFGPMQPLTCSHEEMPVTASVNHWQLEAGATLYSITADPTRSWSSNRLRRPSPCPPGLTVALSEQHGVSTNPGFHPCPGVQSGVRGPDCSFAMYVSNDFVMEIIRTAELRIKATWS